MRALLSALIFGGGLATTAARAQALAFGPRTDYAVGQRPTALALADVNGDGYPDLLTANQGRSRGDRGPDPVMGFGALLSGLERRPKDKDVGSVTVLLGQANGRFGQRRDYPVGRWPASLAVADVTGDNRPDVLVTCSDFAHQNHLLVLAGQAAGGFAPAVSYPAQLLRQPQVLAVADLDGDGRPDATTAGDTGAGGVQVLLNRPAAGFAPAVDYPTGPHYSARSLALADVNGDGHLDALVTNGEGYDPDSAVVLLPGRRGGQFGPPTVYASELGPTAVGDVNHDRWPDLVAVSAHARTVRLGGPTGLGPAIRTTVRGPKPYSLALTDLDGDGRLDVVTTHYEYAASVSARDRGWVAVRLAQADGTWAEPTNYLASPYYADQLVAGDANGDGRPDLLLANRNASAVSVLLSQRQP